MLSILSYVSVLSVCPLVLEVLATVIKQEKEIKGIQIVKEEVKLSLFADDIIVYIEYPIDSTKKLLNLVSEFGKTADTKSIFRNQRHFCTPTMESHKQKSGKKIPRVIASRKNKVPRNKLNQGGKRPVHRKLQNTEE